MDWLDTFLNMALGGLPASIAALCPAPLKRRAAERFRQANPFRTIAVNHDLVRATRLAWIEAARDVCGKVRRLSREPEWRGQSGAVDAFDGLVLTEFDALRDGALDRNRDPGISPVDRHVEAVINGVAELVAPGRANEPGESVTADFTRVLADLSGWQASEVPGLYRSVAASGLATPGGGPARGFGELVLSAFAELVKDPGRYPQAREAFHIAMSGLVARSLKPRK